VALAFVDVGIGFANRAAVVVVVGFSQDLLVLHISPCITPETMSTFDKCYNINQKDEEHRTTKEEKEGPILF
jgi:hypothetical protein